MAKKGMKVKELARELGVTSRAIVSRCRAEGFPVQNSITRLKPQMEQMVRTWFVAASDNASDAADAPGSRDDAPPDPSPERNGLSI